MCFSSRKLSSLLSQGWLLETIRADEFLGGEQRCHGGYGDSPARRRFKVAACKWLWATSCYAFFAMLVTIVRSGIHITFVFVKWHCRRIIVKLYRNNLLNSRSSVTGSNETNHFEFVLYALRQIWITSDMIRISKRFNTYRGLEISSYQSMQTWF